MQSRAGCSFSRSSTYLPLKHELAWGNTGYLTYLGRERCIALVSSRTYISRSLLLLLRTCRYLRYDTCFIRRIRTLELSDRTALLTVSPRTRVLGVGSLTCFLASIIKTGLTYVCLDVCRIQVSQSEKLQHLIPILRTRFWKVSAWLLLGVARRRRCDLEVRPRAS